MAYLKEFTGYHAFPDYYNVKLYLSYKKLVLEAKAIDLSLREEYLVVSGKINNAEHPDPDDLKRLFVLEKRNQAHDKLLESKYSFSKQ